MMRSPLLRSRKLPGLWLAACALFAGPAAAEAPDPALKVFLAKFADMAAHGAADSMAKLTQFPLRNGVHAEAAKVSAAGFKHHFQTNGYRDLAPCLKSTPPKPSDKASAALGGWEVECDGNVFYFTRGPDGWRHTGFENNNE